MENLQSKWMTKEINVGGKITFKNACGLPKEDLEGRGSDDKRQVR